MHLVNELLPLCSAHLSVLDMARIAASSKSLQQGCLCIIDCNASRRLIKAVLAAAADREVQHDEEPQSLLQQFSRAAAWLEMYAEAVAAAAGLAVSLDVLLTTPNVPLHLAACLVQAGMRITYEQLVAAASSRVAGAEVWVQAQQRQNITTDIPAAALAICCSADLVR